VLQVLEKKSLFSVCRKAAGPDQVSAANVVLATDIFSWSFRLCKVLACFKFNFQFAFRENRTVEDAVSLCTHTILQLLEGTDTHRYY